MRRKELLLTGKQHQEDEPKLLQVGQDAHLSVLPRRYPEIT
jgi:hypothetical protein